MKPINTSIYDFPTLVQTYVYVDKTAQIYELAKPGADILYYLPRPRRFGKSLLLSTLKALFEGRRALFRGLAIERTDWDWEREVYPVLHLDMSKVSSKSAAELDVALNNFVREHAEQFGARFDSGLPAQSNFSNLLAHVQKTSPNGKYVMLVDEYDAPISGLLDSAVDRRELPLARKTLHDFYVQAKAECGSMRFLLVTGVSKFAKTSIFSAFNNPKDLTFDRRAADLLGYTHEEMETYFHAHIQAFADTRGETYAQSFADLLGWYDGYQFSPDRPVKIVNPVSLGNALVNCQLRNYWEATAGSTLIFDALKAKHAMPQDFEVEVKLKRLDAPDALTAPLVALLFQGGYLTLDTRIDDQRVTLRIPNREVADSLYDGYIAQVFGTDFEIDDFEDDAEKMAHVLAAEGIGEKFSVFLKSGFSRLPHDWVARDEREAKRAFAAFMAFTHAKLYGEVQQATGRPDAVLETKKGIYVFEFKYGRSARAALEQCRTRNYAAAFMKDARPVYYVGVNYNPAEGVRTVDAVLCEPAYMPSR